MLSTSCLLLGHFYPENENSNTLCIAVSLLVKLLAMLMYWDHFHQNNNRIETSIDKKTTAKYVLHLLNQKDPD